MNICNHNHPAISWESSDSISCPMCVLIDAHRDETDRLARQYEKLEDQLASVESEYNDECRRADSLERDNSALEDDIADLESRIKDLEAEIETGEV